MRTEEVIQQLAQIALETTEQHSRNALLEAICLLSVHVLEPSLEMAEQFR